ncbi:hypothetical protein ACIBQ1_43985 [Nonomuraea sp. NPDC050153]|uniref:hypothetical protein n=1 Tax=Nonomuraea sp. NPDC050153 TaxID=3364359 RepID=UPI00379765FD
MFIQVIEGRAIDAGDVREALQWWARELSPRAEGWLGTTAGVTGDGLFVGVTRFATRSAAHRNSDRPEHGQWWIETAKLFAGEVTFLDCDEVFEYLGGGSDAAGFVQVTQGRVRDPGRVRELVRLRQEELAASRPDLIGGTAALYGDGGYLETVYFTGAAAARPPAMGQLFAGDPDFFELREPWLYSPR